jgi:hypothetical protein
MHSETEYRETGNHPLYSKNVFKFYTSYFSHTYLSGIHTIFQVVPDKEGLQATMLLSMADL